MDEATETTTPPQAAAGAVEAPVPQDREGRFDACLAKLEELKAIKARREVMEERVLLEFLRVNRGRLNEFPLLETEQKSLMDMLLRRAEGLHPGQESVRERLVAYLVELNHYGKAKAVGNAAEMTRLAQTLEVEETILAKMLQGAVYASSLVKDNFSDAVIRHFVEGALAKLEELTATMVFDEQYWRANLEQFVKGEVHGAYDDILADRRYRIVREGQLLLVAFPFDAVLAKLKGTSKDIAPTRVQTAFVETTTTEPGRRATEAVASVLARNDFAPWASGADREELVFAARVAAMDAVAAEIAPGEAESVAADEEAEAQRLFHMRQVAGLAVGAAVLLRVIREDFSKALREFSPKERTVLVAAAGYFDSQRVSRVLEEVMELDFAHLLRDKAAAEGGRIQIKTSRVRRAPRAAVDALAAAGLSKIRRKQVFEDDPDQVESLLFKTRNASELGARLELLQVEPELARSVTGLWENAAYKVELYVCINLAALGKVTTNLSARITEILGRYGITPAGAAETSKTRHDA